MSGVMLTALVTMSMAEQALEEARRQTGTINKIGKPPTHIRKAMIESIIEAAKKDVSKVVADHLPVIIAYLQAFAANPRVHMWLIKQAKDKELKEDSYTLEVWRLCPEMNALDTALMQILEQVLGTGECTKELSLWDSGLRLCG